MTTDILICLLAIAICAILNLFQEMRSLKYQNSKLLKELGAKKDMELRPLISEVLQQKKDDKEVMDEVSDLISKYRM